MASPIRARAFVGAAERVSRNREPRVIANAANSNSPMAMLIDMNRIDNRFTSPVTIEFNRNSVKYVSVSVPGLGSSVTATAVNRQSSPSSPIPEMKMPNGPKSAYSTPPPNRET